MRHYQLPGPFDWITIPAGPVTLDAGGYVPEPAAFDVAAFAIARYPVTNAQFAAFVEAGGYDQRQWWSTAGWALRERYGWDSPRYWGQRDYNGPDCPIVGVSWYEASAFCRWLGDRAGRHITLPTEQQWQRAAQGDDGREFPWGGAEPNAAVCNWNRDIDETTPVTQYPDGASAFGVMDMSGNVWEWCQTGWESGTLDPDSREVRLLRGGSWSSDSPISLRAVHRSPLDPNARLAPDYRHHATVGFRVVCL